MADTNINESSSRKTKSLLDDMHTELDGLRVIHDIMIDELCKYVGSDADSAMRVNERLFVLLDGLKHKLNDVGAIREKALEISRAKQAS